ncbi:MAG: type I-E CRISPR-associated protein Cse2/CasB [Oscillatoriales cyanobacterium SM2_1_8]|nr:type I-E CRISPR-associated protein Cse2/CasB [Oscillatoriales cyanobacterium SM2_1_8]
MTREMDYLTYVENRLKRDTGTKADLKRALSGEEKHLRATYPVLLPLLTGISQQQQEVWIFVASLSAFYSQTIPKEFSKQSNFGHSCFALQKKTNSNGVERRFRALLDTSLADIQTPIASLVRQMKSKGVSLHYPQLLADLNQWEHPDQYIQDRWARSFWQAEAPSESSNGQEE